MPEQNSPESDGNIVNMLSTEMCKTDPLIKHGWSYLAVAIQSLSDRTSKSKRNGKKHAKNNETPV